MKYDSIKERGAEVCKQTEIVAVPIRLNRKPSQLDVYSEPRSRGQGLWKEHFLDSQQTDGAASGRRWQLGAQESITSSLEYKKVQVL